MAFKNFEEMAAAVKAHPVTKRLVLCCAHDPHSLEAVNEAVKDGMIKAVLVGRKRRSRSSSLRADMMPLLMLRSTMRKTMLKQLRRL